MFSPNSVDASKTRRSEAKRFLVRNILHTSNVIVYRSALVAELFTLMKNVVTVHDEVTFLKLRYLRDEVVFSMFL